MKKIIGFVSALWMLSAGALAQVAALSAAPVAQSVTQSIGQSAVQSTNAPVFQPLLGPISFSMSPDASFAFAKLYSASTLITRAQCTVFAERLADLPGEASQAETNRIECDQNAFPLRILLPKLVISMQGSSVQSWGGESQRSILVTQNFAKNVWEKLHAAVWANFTGREDASIYYPILSCDFHRTSHTLHDCSEIHTIDRTLGSKERAQVFCIRQTQLRHGANGAVAGYNPENPEFSERQVLSDTIQDQIARGDRKVTAYSCIFMD